MLYFSETRIKERTLKLEQKYIDRFWERVDVRGTDECWEWQAGTSSGYGRLTINGKDFRTHRISWILHNGEIPDGLFVCHKCDNRLCVNPNHFFLGTHEDNMKDKIRKGRQSSTKGYRLPNKRKSVWGEKVYSAKLTEQEVLEIKALLSFGLKQTSIAKAYGVTNKNISLIHRGKTWTHVQI